MESRLNHLIYGSFRYQLLYGMVVRMMHQNLVLRIKGFDRIIYNFPYVGHFHHLRKIDLEFIKKFQTVISSFYKSSKMLLAERVLHILNNTSVNTQHLQIKVKVRNCIAIKVSSADSVEKDETNSDIKDSLASLRWPSEHLGLCLSHCFPVLRQIPHWTALAMTVYVLVASANLTSYVTTHSQNTFTSSFIPSAMFHHALHLQLISFRT